MNSHASYCFRAELAARALELDVSVAWRRTLETRHALTAAHDAHKADVDAFLAAFAAGPDSKESVEAVTKAAKSLEALRTAETADAASEQAWTDAREKAGVARKVADDVLADLPAG